MGNSQQIPRCVSLIGTPVWWLAFTSGVFFVCGSPSCDFLVSNLPGRNLKNGVVVL